MTENPNYNPNKPTYKFNEEEIIQLRDETLLYGSLSSFELSEELTIELMEYYNIKNYEQLSELIRPKEVEITLWVPLIVF